MMMWTSFVVVVFSRGMPLWVILKRVLACHGLHGVVDGALWYCGLGMGGIVGVIAIGKEDILDFVCLVTNVVLIADIINISKG
jgi:hypothetical protein